MPFVKAERRKAKARVALCGPSGSGKSLSGLMLAKGLGGRIAAIDTEHQSLALYSGLFDFDVDILTSPFSPERYIERITEAEKAGYEVILIDSLSHEWIGPGGILDIHGKLGGNSFAAWKSVTPRHDALIQKLLSSPCHIIATMRTKTGYIQSQDKDGKTRIEKAGMDLQQRDGVDYEFTCVFDLSLQHVASVSKDRTGLFDGTQEVITEATGTRLSEWLERGTAEPVEPQPEANSGSPATMVDRKGLADQIRTFAKQAGLTSPDAFGAWLRKRHRCRTLRELSLEQLRETAETLAALAGETRLAA